VKREDRGRGSGEVPYIKIPLLSTTLNPLPRARPRKPREMGRKGREEPLQRMEEEAPGQESVSIIPFRRQRGRERQDQHIRGKGKS